VSSSPICVDASLVIRFLDSRARSEELIALWEQWYENKRSLVAPSLLFYEVSNAPHQYVVHGVLLPREADAALDAALQLHIQLHTDAQLHRRALDLARRHSLPATYDAHYLALAEQLGAEYWTTDRRLESDGDQLRPRVSRALRGQIQAGDCRDCSLVGGAYFACRSLDRRVMLIKEHLRCYHARTRRGFSEVIKSISCWDTPNSRSLAKK
jgi:predicted nucleic acid-binding protein